MPRFDYSTVVDTTILPPPKNSAWEWQLDASCRGQPSDTFFGAEEAPVDEFEAAAKKICVHCPVILNCREHAIRTREPHGIWGGLSPLERKQQRWLYS